MTVYVRSHRHHSEPVGSVEPLRADEKLWGVYAPDGALIVRVRRDEAMRLLTAMGG